MILAINRTPSPNTANTVSAQPSQSGTVSLGGGSFQEILNHVERGGDLHQELLQFEQKIANGVQFSSSELLYFQIRTAQYGLKVELVSKLAESVNSTVKRLQNQG